MGIFREKGKRIARKNGDKEWVVFGSCRRVGVAVVEGH